MPIRSWKKEVLTLPNLLSLSRLLLIPVYMGIYLRASRASDYILAAGILTFSCITDAIDGWIARRFKMISSVGKLLDPLADKATQFSLILCVSIKYPQLRQVMQPVIILFVIKESFQLMALLLSLRKGIALTGALWAGKICTFVLFVSLILIVMLPDLPEHLLAAIAVTDGCFLAFSFASYMLTYWVRPQMLHKIQSENE